MEINKIKRSLLVLFFSFLAIGAQAQLEQAVKKIFAGDTITGGHVPLKRDSDSIHLVNMQKSLDGFTQRSLDNRAGRDSKVPDSVEEKMKLAGHGKGR